MSKPIRSFFALLSLSLFCSFSTTAFAQDEDENFSAGSGEEMGLAKMTYIGFQNLEDKSRLFLRLSEKVSDYRIKKKGSNVLVLEVDSASIPLRNNKNHLDTTFFNSPIKMITPSEVDDGEPQIRIIIEMKESVPYQIRLEGNELVVYFKK